MLVLLTSLLAAAAAAAAGAGVSEAARLEGRRAVRGARGGAATLYCQVTDAQDSQVSWIRSRDLQILAHGGAVFTGDARVSAGAAGAGGGRRHWLRLQPLRARDAGRYECQLNTEPKQSLFVELLVLDPEELAAETSTAPAETSGGGGGGGERNDTGGEAAPRTDVMQRDEAAAAAGSTAERHVLLILLLHAATAVRWCCSTH